MKFSAKLEGAGQLGRGLKAIARPKELEAIKLLAMIAAGAPIRDAARLEAPFDEGRLSANVEMETKQPTPRRVPTRTGVAIWVRNIAQYRPRAETSKRRGKKRAGLDYQEASTPEVYGAFQQFGTKKMAANQWMTRAWDQAGGKGAVNRVSRVLNRGLVRILKQRLSGR